MVFLKSFFAGLSAFVLTLVISLVTNARSRLPEEMASAELGIDESAITFGLLAFTFGFLWVYHRLSKYGPKGRDLKIRRMVKQDVESVVTLWHTTKKAAYPYLPLEQARTLDEDYSFFNEEILVRCDVWIAEDREEVVGFLAIQGNYIDRLYVLPHVQRKGIGTALIKRAMDLSSTGLQLHTHQKNKSARDFYEKHGFTAVRFGVSPPPESEPDVEYHWRSDKTA